MMAPEPLDPPADTTAAWLEVAEQEALAVWIEQVTCGLTTHAGPVCDWCGAKV